MALASGAPGASLMLLLALALGAAAEHAARPKRTSVLVMRHCVRSTEDQGIFAVADHGFYDNYSSQPWASFGSEPMACLDRGLEIVRAQGTWLAQKGNLPQPVRVFADKVSRDEETGKALLEGLGVPVNEGSLLVNASIFYPKEECNMTRQDRTLAIEGCMAVQPRGTDFVTMESTLFDILGQGAAGDWRLVEPCGEVVDPLNGAPAGACQAASSFVERMFMEWGAGMKVGWGNIDVDKLPEIMKLHTWYRTTKGACKAVARKEQASIVNAVMQTLEDAAGGTMVYAGHDTQMNALQGVLGLTWRPSPWPDNPTFPGSALRFDREGDRVSVSYVYVKNYSETSGAMESVNVEISGTDEEIPSMISMVALRTLVENGADAACVTPQPEWPPHPSAHEQEFGAFTRFFKEVTALIIAGICCLCCWCLHCADTKNNKVTRSLRTLEVEARDEGEEAQAVPLTSAVQSTPCPSEAGMSSPPSVSRPVTGSFQHGPGFSSVPHPSVHSSPPAGSFVFPQEISMSNMSGSYVSGAMESGQVTRQASGSIASGRYNPYAGSGVHTPMVHTPGLLTPAGPGRYPSPGSSRPLDPSRIRQV